MKTNHLRSVTAATMALLLAASAPFQTFAAEENPAGSYSADQQRLADNQLDYDEIGARVKEYYGPIKSAYAMARGMKEDQARSQSIQGPPLMTCSPRQKQPKIWQKNKAAWSR